MRTRAPAHPQLSNESILPHGSTFVDAHYKLDALRTELAATHAIRSFFGEVGAAMRVDVLEHDESSQESLLCVDER